MRKKYIFGKKLYISVLTSILVLLTTVATTFAWVGVFANSTFETFDFNIKASNLQEYGILISSTGEIGSFSESIPAIDIKRQILENWGISTKNKSDTEIESIFIGLNMSQCTTLPVLEGNSIKKLGDFRTIENVVTKKYYKFDIYITPTRFYEGNSSSNYLLDVYLDKDMITGNDKTMTLDGSIDYSASFNNPLENLPSNIRKINGGETFRVVTVNSKSACRVAFEKYAVTTIGDLEFYENSSPNSTIIYSGDSYNYPTYNESNSTYEFGGILPDNENFAVKYYNTYDYGYAKNGVHSVSVPNDIYNARGVTSATADRVLTSSTNHLIDSENINEQISLNKMMKVSISFWIEGWDADCFNVLNRNPIALNISLSITNEERF